MFRHKGPEVGAEAVISDADRVMDPSQRGRVAVTHYDATPIIDKFPDFGALGIDVVDNHKVRILDVLNGAGDTVSVAVIGLDRLGVIAVADKVVRQHSIANGSSV